MISNEVSQNANGLALSPDGKWLYVVMTDLCSVVKLSSQEDGRVGRVQPVIELEQAVPDGIATDEEGNLYIGCYAPDRIYRLSPNGELDILVEDWKRNTLASPTNLAFGGPDRHTLIVANFARWDLVTATLPVRGREIYYPKID